jgi:hypothetical protein
MGLCRAASRRQRGAKKGLDPQKLEPNSSANYINDGIDGPHLVKMDLIDREAMNFRLRFSKALKYKSAPFFGLLGQGASFNQIQYLF